MTWGVTSCHASNHDLREDLCCIWTTLWTQIKIINHEKPQQSGWNETRPQQNEGLQRWVQLIERSCLHLDVWSRSESRLICLLIHKLLLRVSYSSFKLLRSRQHPTVQIVACVCVCVHVRVSLSQMKCTTTCWRWFSLDSHGRHRALCELWPPPLGRQESRCSVTPISRLCCGFLHLYKMDHNEFWSSE